MNDRHQSPSYPLRIPKDLKDQVTKAAFDTGRSFNAEVTARLQGSFDFIASLPLMVQDAVEDTAAAKGCTPEAALVDLVLAGQSNGGKVLNIRIAPGMTIKEVHELLGAMQEDVPDATIVVVDRE